MAVKGSKHSTIPVTERAAAVHNNKYDYSLIQSTGMHDKVDVICPDHGVFTVAMKDHIYRKTGCPQCGTIRMMEVRTGTFARWDTTRFIAEAMKVHGDRYDYTNTVYTNAHTKLIVTCTIHGPWRPTPSSHIRGNSEFGNGCPKCSVKVSAPERRIMKTLDSLGTPYTYQFACGATSDIGRTLRYDFYIPSINTLVEYDGRQHTEEVSLFPGYPRRVILDKIKDDWAADSDYRLVRIPHTVMGKRLDAAIINLINS